MSDYDGDESEDDRSLYWQQTQRLYALNEFLKQSAFIPNRADGSLNPKLLADYTAATEEVFEAVRRIASRS